MRVFIANFGLENYEWPECLSLGTVATMNSLKAQAFWEAGDRGAYIEERMQGKTAAGIEPTKPVASRWFNLMTIISETENDIWIHRQKEQLWWTRSLPGAPSFTRKTEPVGAGREVVVCHKPCEPWSNKSSKGVGLTWSGLHPKARDFLSTESTLQQLGEDNAAYALALIWGEDLSPWHTRPAWNAKIARSKSKAGAVTGFTARQRAAVRMADTARRTVTVANGQIVEQVAKVKDLEFNSQAEFEQYVMKLIELQEGLCALSGLKMQFDGEYEDVELLSSLDRIDSGGHYAPGNLQITCRFINRWKGSGTDAEIKRLLNVVRSIDGE